ncbi:hypothetical protein [Pseudaminobacter soli (ex Li et al. 2025)]|uniref:DUF680 domain-containing protein n=1 Tax=Pseudaminobacter soli (ex Li et al. 2025) TaxID=1295366 RepID=A0A2P7S616_9HYPH|nr:hypothetical protein [Mesorhizobium soli]PSJ57906.1 hypothetical protein C7I85_21305 [Mesorhizobium soli]
MNKTFVALAAVLLASSTAYANNRYGDAAPVVNQVNSGVIATTAPDTSARYGDAAKASVVVNAPSNDFTSSAAIGTPVNRLGASSRILYGSN